MYVCDICLRLFPKEETVKVRHVGKVLNICWNCFDEWKNPPCEKNRVEHDQKLHNAQNRNEGKNQE